MLQDKRLQAGHFIKYLGTLHGSQHGGVEAMYGSLPAHIGAAQPGSSVAEQPTFVSATLMKSAGAGDGISNTSALALVESAPADVQPTTTEPGAPTLPSRDTARRRAERALALLTATCASLSAKHAIQGPVLRSCSLYLQARSRSADATRCSVACGIDCSTCIH